MFGESILQTAQPNSDLIKILQEMKRLINVPFFIAGGSVFSSIYGSDFNDIDVWFYNKDDYDTASNILLNLSAEREKKEREEENTDPFDVSLNAIRVYSSSYSHHQSKNSLTLTGFIDAHPIQLICKNFGTPEDILLGFDLFNSMVCITSDGDVFRHPHSSQELKVNYNLINFQTLQRAFKYMETKKCVDNNDEIKKLISYIVENAFESMLDGYTETKYQAIVSICRQQFKGKFEKFFYQVHDKIRSIYNAEDRIKLFKRIITNKTLRRVPLHHDMCMEYYLAYYLYLYKRNKVKLDDTNVFPAKVWSDLGDKYPEYLL